MPGSRRSPLASLVRLPRWPALAALTLLLMGATARVDGQAGAARSGAVRSGPVTVETPNATRAELTAALDAADRAKRTGEAAAIRARLANGDFRPGDRFLVTLATDTMTHLEMVVRDGPSIEWPNLPVMPLGGVLRSELRTAIVQHLGKFVRNPEVTVVPLLRMSITGAVQRPGLYTVPPDAPVTELLMAAGGPMPQARTDRVVVARGGREVLDRKAYQRAARDGRTLEQAGLRSGDEVRVPEKSTRNWAQIASYAFFGVSALTALLALIRSGYSD